ncbi:MAG: SWIM zinc finger family protein [Acidobacteria bacterium]|nr:SWIM zinc finger family protein [Acidobacteriota bacterium]
MIAHPVLRFVGQLTPAILEESFGPHVLRRAEQYAGEGRIDDIWIDGAALRAHVAGSMSSPYHCVIRIHEGALEAECSCPYRRGMCWHIGAVLVALRDDAPRLAELGQQALRGTRAEPADDAAQPVPPGAPAPAPSEDDILRLADRLLATPKCELCEILARAAAHDHDILARLPDARGAANLDIRLFRQAACAALRPGHALGRHELPRVAADVADITRSVARLAGGAQAEPALDLLLELAWRVWARMDEVDDRDGALGACVREVLLGWVRGWAEVPSRDRQKIAREIFGWVTEDAGGLTRGLITEARVALGPIGMETLAGLLRPAIEARRGGRGAAAGDVDGAAPRDALLESLRGALRELSQVRGDIDEFFAQCDPDGAHGTDVVAAARLLSHQGRLDEALSWVERGRRRARGTARGELDELRIALLGRLGRRREAIEAAWESFLAEPGAASFHRLCSASGDEDRPEWRRRALDHADAGSDATAFVEVCLAAGDAERLAHRVETTPGFVLSAAPAMLERSLALLEKGAPDAASAVHVQLAAAILARGDSRAYPEARQHLEQARRAHLVGASAGAWDEIAGRLAQAHAIVREWFP